MSQFDWALRRVLLPPGCVCAFVYGLLTPRMRECEQLTFVVPLGCLRLVNSSGMELAFSLAKRPHSGWGLDVVALRRVNKTG